MGSTCQQHQSEFKHREIIEGTNPLSQLKKQRCTVVYNADIVFSGEYFHHLTNVKKGKSNNTIKMATRTLQST